MGEVYRARDTRLGRNAALKVIAPGLIGHPSLRRRFETEARAASALNHPAVVTIYDVGESGGVSWIAMEWVEGRTLRDAISEGSMPVAQVVSIARQIADGLAAAHAKGIVHRDLKPENIMLGEGGRAKILDFGLARQTVIDKMEVASQIDTPTAVMGGATMDGAILGTIGYMSPEQASGQTVDFRSDQFSFGLILYEMLAGRRAFERPSKVEVLAAIIREDPVALSSFRAGVPQALDHLVSRCLAKRPEERFASTGEIASELDNVGAEVATGRASSVSTSVPTEVRGGALARSRRPTRRMILLAGAALVVLLAATIAWVQLRPPPDAIQSLAVLPFGNATNDPNAEYLGNGLTESLIDQMSRVPSLKVIARATVSRFKGTTDPPGVGRQLGVGAVLVGSVMKRDGQIVISAELVESATGSRLWGQTYDRPATDLLRVQDSIAWEIVDGLRLRLSGEERRSLVAHTTQNPEAWELYLKARFLLHHDTEEDDLQARRLYLQAIEKDPKFVDAYTGVASTYARSAGNGYAPPREAWIRAGEYIRKALDLDPGNFGARASLAIRHFSFDWDWSLAEIEFRGLSADPRLFTAFAYHGVAVFYWASGRPQEAVALMDRALRVDPRSVQSRVMMADFLAEAGRFDAAINHYKAIMAAEPDDPRALFGLANVLRRRGDATAAIEALRKAYELTGEDVGAEALANARTADEYDKGDIAVARYRLDQLEAMAETRYVSPLDLARLHAKAGNRERAFTLLESALAERSPALVYLKVDRAWDRIRDDPRFAAAVQRVGIP